MSFSHLLNSVHVDVARKGIAKCPLLENVSTWLAHKHAPNHR
jgi:hypothetical protein